MATRNSEWSDVTLWDVFWHWIRLYTQYSIKIFTFNMFLSSCKCMCDCVAMCLYINMETWEYSFHFSDYLRVCVLIFVKVSLFLSLPIQFLVLSSTLSITLQSLRHQTFCYKTCLTVEIILTITYNYFVVTFSISLLWSTCTVNNIHTHTLTYYTGTCINSQANALISVNRPRRRRESGINVL